MIPPDHAMQQRVREALGLAVAPLDDLRILRRLFAGPVDLPPAQGLMLRERGLAHVSRVQADGTRRCAWRKGTEKRLLRLEYRLQDEVSHG